MAICRSCSSYYKHNAWNSSPECEECVDSLNVPVFDEEDTVEVEHLLHPSGKTPARFSDE